MISSGWKGSIRYRISLQSIGWHEVERSLKMALYRRGHADYYANGEHIQESTGTVNKREAKKYLALRISEVQRGVFVKTLQWAQIML